MNLFATKKEAIITVAIAAFFVLVTIAFTFEPLATVILRSRDLPADTVISATIPDNVPNDQLFQDGQTILGIDGVVAPDGGMIEKDVSALLSSVTGVRSLNVIAQGAGVLPVTLTLSGTSNPDTTNFPLIKLIAAYFSPSENTVVMPDSTTYTEIVADPNRGDVSKLPIPLSVKLEDNVTTISTSNNPLGKANKYLSPISCAQLPSGVKIINFARIRDSFVGNMIFSLKEYLANFSCFQSFSTFD